MSALAAVLGPAAGSSSPVLQKMLVEMQNRAAGPAFEFAASEAHIVAARHEWEATLSGWVGPLIAEDEDWVVAADASLYYLPDLRRRLGVSQREADTGRLLLLALRAWGPRFARFVEGDYAIVAWERRRGRVLLARDFGSRRSLSFAITGSSLVVASSPNAVILHPDVSADYDPTFLALAASGNMAHGPRTAYRNVEFVTGGSTLSFEDGKLVEVDRWKLPPVGSAWEPQLSQSAADELRALLVDATRERLAPSGATTVWMSGGWDSPAVFASGNVALAAGDRGDRRILPISVTFPADDSGNEDGYIRAIADRWSAPVRWVEIDQVPLVEDLARRARVRDDPFIQPYESMVRTLARNTLALGSRVALEGFGGDHLFMTSTGPVIADHVYYGRWAEVWHEWKRWPGSARQFARMCLLPHLSPSMRDWIQTVRGRPIAGYWDRALADWFVRTPDVAAQLGPETERLPGEGAAEYESRTMISKPVVSRAVAMNHLLGLEEGVQPRGPLFDGRVMSFAVARPMSDRGIWGDNKRLLRLAMKGILPDAVLQSRTTKTGTPAGYLGRQLLGTVSADIDELFGRRHSNLERLGVVDRSAILAATKQFMSDANIGVGATLLATLEVERWLAVREHTS